MTSRRPTPAADFVGNPEQLAAYNSTGHCVVLAGPGSGKTKTLVSKLALILAADVRAPRGVACITYSQECARELTRRLERLGVRDAPNLFIGTVHSFCLRHLVMPYARLAGLALPYPLSIATSKQADICRTRAGDALFGVHHPHKVNEMLVHRRMHLDRTKESWRRQPELARWAERYDAELRGRGLIDFDDLVIAGQILLEQHDWVSSLVHAKFPVIAVDEYQDLGVGLHRIVQRLAFEGGVRLFAVGDADQTVYQFNGADEALLLELAARPDVKRVQLQLNYRSAGRIVNASELALGESRGYRASDPDRHAVIDFVYCPGGLEDQARRAVAEIVPAALEAKSGRNLGDIAILYRDSKTGDIAAKAAAEAGLSFIRVDNAAPYKKSALTSWVEDCAEWCAGGWREGQPRLRGLLDRWRGFHGGRLGPQHRRVVTGAAVQFLWNHRRSEASAHEFLCELRAELVDSVVSADASLADQVEQLHRMSTALAPGGALEGLSLARLGGRDGAPDQLNLLTLHSAKGCEYDVVIMIGLDLGSLPWRNESPKHLKESRKLFYVGFTRPRDEIHMLYSGFVDTRRGRQHWGRSPFVAELEQRLKRGTIGGG